MELFFVSLLLVALSNAQNLDKGSSHDHSVTHNEHQNSFSCEGRVSGYYADIESGCQLYHLCDADGRRSTHSCPNATLFQQRMMICDHWYMVDCNKSVHDYKANLLIGQRDKPFIGDDHNHHREPVNFFTIHQRAGSLQQPNWFPLVVSRTQQEPVDIENTVPIPSPTVSSVHIGNRNLGNTGSNSPSSNPRQARYRDPNLDHRSFEHQSSTNNYATSSNSRSAYSDDFPSVAPEKITVYPQYPQTRPQARLPEAYSNNPFFQSLVSKSASVPPNIPSHTNSRVQIHGEVQPSRQEKPTVKLEDIANIRFSHQETLPQQSSERRTKGFPFESNRAQNYPSQLTEHRNTNVLTSNQHLQPPERSHVPPVSDATTSRHANSHLTTTKGKISEKEDNLNNIVELHLLDPRRMFYIPESKTHDEERGNSTVLHISVPASPNSSSSSSNKRSHGAMYFRNDIKTSAGQNPQCPKCHPAFLIPGRCSPCVVIR